MKNREILFTTILLVLACFFGLSPTTKAVDPPPDGFYPNQNTAEGEDALFNLTSATGNTAVGFNALYTNTNGAFNTAIGCQALFNNLAGFQNTAIGSFALHNNIGEGFLSVHGHVNTATGDSALRANTTGSENTANGANALFVNTEGRSNTAVGFEALLENTTGNNNTATGSAALRSNETGINNTANGSQALFSNKTGDNNTANGIQALYSNIDGINNTANGLNALFSNTSGSENTANGHGALFSNTTGNDNTADGHDALFNNTTGSNNIAIGHGAGSNLTTGSNNIDIGFFGVAGEANTIRIGTQGTQTATFIAGISGAPIGGGGAVRVNANGQLGTAPSSARFKENIKPMDTASEAIHALKPVTFHYKKEFDPEGAPQFGLVAEDVETVNPDLVARDDQGKVYTVRYDAVNAMLLNEFLKEHRKVQELEKQVEKLTAGLQKVSVQVEMSRAAPQMVLNNQ